MKNTYEATDKTYLHMEVHLSQKAESLYLVLKKVDQNADEQLAVNAIANGDTLSFAFDSLSQVTGQY